VIKTRKTWVALTITIIAVVALIIALPFARGYVIQKFGIEVNPSQKIPVIKTQVFLQNDAAWSGDKLGVSDYSMGGHGCLVCCIASAMCALGPTTDPGSLNSALADNGAYTEEGEIIWGKLKALGADYTYSRDFSAQTLERDLKAGLLPIVKVKYRGAGVFHWVLVVGADNEDFLVLDPLNAAKEPIPLKTHGRVFAYRVLIKA
jgi:hypothetical protein